MKTSNWSKVSPILIGFALVFCASLAHASGATQAESALISNHAAGIVVGEVGTATATPQKLRQSIRASKTKIEKLRI